MNKSLGKGLWIALVLAGLIAMAVPSALAQSASPGEIGAPHRQWRGGGGHGHYPHIRHGIRLLRHARRMLNHGAHDFGGHRAAAVGQIDQALNNLHLALEVTHNNEPARHGYGGFNRGPANGAHLSGANSHNHGSNEMAGQERHPDIRGGLRLCRRAKDVLGHAAHDFDGHRAAAIQNVNQAIAQLQQALRYDKR